MRVGAFIIPLPPIIPMRFAVHGNALLSFTLEDIHETVALMGGGIVAPPLWVFVVARVVFAGSVGKDFRLKANRVWTSVWHAGC